MKLLDKTGKPRTGIITIGIPKAMMFYEHGRLWEDFFRGLGCGVVTSGGTNRKILNDGVGCSSNENCLPVKVLTGHVMELINRSDYIFIPRYTTTGKLEFTCPKFCGLPDMMRMNFGSKARIIELDIDYNDGLAKTEESLKKLAPLLGIDYERIHSSFLSTVKNHIGFEMETAEELEPDYAVRPSIALLGHPYVIQDTFINMDLRDKLHSRGYNVLSPANLDQDVKRQNVYPQQNFFYGVGYDILGSAFTYAQDPNVRGLIYISTFSCGVDSILTEYIERHLKTIAPIPYLKITIDEQTGEAGFDTRLEAFLDMIGEAPKKAV